MSSPTREVDVVAGDDHRLKKEFGTVGLLFTAIGSIIGSGWLFSSLHTAAQAVRRRSSPGSSRSSCSC